MTGENPAPGWYDDPETPQTLRYWDGQAWTDDRQVKPSAAAPPPPPGSFAPPPPGSFAPAGGNYEQSQAGWALGLSIAGLVCCGLLCIPGFVMGRREVQAIDAGRINPSQRGVAMAAQIVGGIGIAFLALGVLYLVVVFGFLASSA